MALHAAGDLSVAEFRAMLGALGIAQHRVAQLFGVGPRSVRRWRDGTRRVPAGVSIVFRLLATGAVMVDQVEQAAAAISGRTNGREPEPPAPLRVEPTPASVPANPGPITLAEKVCRLTGCRWPVGDPEHPDFFFCNAAVIEPPYCPRHRDAAYLARQPGRRHSAHTGFVTYGRHGRPSIPATSASRAPKVLLDRAGGASPLGPC